MFLFGWWFLWSLDWVHNFCLFFGFCGLLEVLYAVTFQFELWMKLIAWYLSSWERRGLVFLNCMDDTQHIQPNASMFPHRLECLMDDSFEKQHFSQNHGLILLNDSAVSPWHQTESLVNRQDTQMRHIKMAMKQQKHKLTVYIQWLNQCSLTVNAICFFIYILCRSNHQNNFHINTSNKYFK